MTSSVQLTETTEAWSQESKRFSLLRMLSPDLLEEPHAFYRALREYEPVHWDPYMHAWVVTSYQDVITVLMQYSADRTPALDLLERRSLTCMKPFADIMQRQMMFMDGASHKRLRSICSAAFTPRKVEELRGTIARIAEELLDRVVGRGRMDMIEDFANPLPAIVTARLLGVPVEDHAQLHAWVLDVAEVLGNFQHDPQRVAAVAGSLDALKEYVIARMQEQRRTPQDGLIHALMTAEVDGQRLSDEEVVANTIITLIGGHETTTNLIASGFLTLLRHPESLSRLRENPKSAPSAVEELLRYESPVQHTARIAPCDGELGGKQIRKGARLVAVLGAANRDPKRFPNPDRLDLLRENNRHVAFGWAAHFCFGASLARMEGQIAMNALAQRLPHPVLAEQKLVWRQNAGLRGLTRLEIHFDRA